MRDLLKQAKDALIERNSYYYERGVPHQHDLPHCMCRTCIDDRRKLLYAEIDAELAKPEEPTVPLAMLREISPNWYGVYLSDEAIAKVADKYGYKAV